MSSLSVSAAANNDIHLAEGGGGGGGSVSEGGAGGGGRVLQMPALGAFSGCCDGRLTGRHAHHTLL